MRFFAVFILLAFCAHQSQSSSEQNVVTYENPLRTSAEDEVTNLPGLNTAINFRQYSGYLQGDTKAKKFLHYWFVESQNDPGNDPVVLWLNGGPGCSSMEGLFAELGPFEIQKDGKTLKLRKYSWNKMANVLFLESPSGVGFSYATSRLNVHTDDSTARENYQSLKSFYKKFPQYKNNSLYLTGESYAGVYLPTLGVLVDQDPGINLKGIAIGNGYLDASKLSDSLVFFAYHHGLLGKSTWDKVSKDCCQNSPPSRESCALSGKDSSYKCAFDVYEIMYKLYSGLNPYNLYADCEGSGSLRKLRSSNHTRRERIDAALLNLALDPHDKRDQHPFYALDLKQRNLKVQPPCTDEHSLVNYLNQKEVREAIHIPREVGPWDLCSALAYIVKYPKLPGGLAPQMNLLIDSPRKLKLVVYNGDVDTVCNFLGDEWFVDDLGRKIISDYKPWKVDKQIAGFVKHYDGITYVTIRGSGHMVPQDRPREAFSMMGIFLNSSTHRIDL